MEIFGSAEAVWRAGASDYLRYGLSQRELPALLNKELSEAEKIAERCEPAEIRMLALADTDYPACLQTLEDAPTLLYCRGRLPRLDERPAIGMVGARNASSYGLAAAKRLGYQLARCGAIVVTGLARGIDTLAAEGALLGDAPVIGVLGCGVDVIYPRENRYLYQDVMRNGCILSEYPPGTLPLAGNFPPRNRIISGLSDGVIVVEAAEKSGALITATHALEQGRDVFVVPGTIDNPACVGSNRLLRNGALAISSGWDAIQEYEFRYPDTVVEFHSAAPDEGAQNGAEERRSSAQEKTAGTANGAEAPAEAGKPDAPLARPEKRPIDVEALADRLNADELCLLRLVQDGPLQLDELIAGSGIPTARALGAITILEIKGYLIRLPGRFYRLAEG